MDTLAYLWQDIKSYLSGKKTYIVGTYMVGIGLWLGDQALTLQGLAVITLRAGISQ